MENENYDAPLSKMDRKEGPIGSELIKLDRALHRLEDTFNTLQSKISPILNPTPRNEMAEEGPVGGSEISSIISEKKRTIDRITNEIEATIESCEL